MSAADLAFPAPDEAILWLDDFANMAETAFGEHSRRGIEFRERVGADHVRSSIRRRIIDERLRRFSGKSLAAIFWNDSIANFDEARHVAG